MNEETAGDSMVMRLRSRHQLHHFGEAVDHVLIEDLIADIVNLYDAFDIAQTVLLPGQGNQTGGIEYRQAVKIHCPVIIGANFFGKELTKALTLPGEDFHGAAACRP